VLVEIVQQPLDPLAPGPGRVGGALEEVQVVDVVVEAGVLALQDADVPGEFLAAPQHREQRALLLGHVRPEDDEQLVEVGAGAVVVAGGEVRPDVGAQFAQPVVLVHEPGDGGQITAAAVVAHSRQVSS
jgi:hypothetical protein